MNYSKSSKTGNLGCALTAISKSIGLPDRLDIGHEYAFYTMEYGVPRYWFKDQFGNYYAYNNAPEDHPDHNFHLGEPLLDVNQPLPHSDMEFYTPEGLKKNMAVEAGVQPTQNPAYNKMDLSAIWYEFYPDKEGKVQYIYLDADIKENPCLWVQQQLRSTASGLPGYRKYAADLFSRNHPKDKQTGLILMLVDQAMYSMEQLTNASVGDLSIADKTVTLLNKKFLCDDTVFDYLTSLQAGREEGDPLFEIDTTYGKYPFSLKYLSYVFQSVAVSPVFLPVFHANSIYSRCLTRLSLQQVPLKQALEQALDEVASALATTTDVNGYVDTKLRTTLSANYPPTGMAKGLPATGTDITFLVDSALSAIKPDEQQFCDWLFGEPMHEVSEQDQAAMEEYESQEEPTEDAQVDEVQTEPEEGDEPAAKDGDAPTEEKAPAPDAQ